MLYTGARFVNYPLLLTKDPKKQIAEVHAHRSFDNLICFNVFLYRTNIDTAVSKKDGSVFYIKLAKQSESLWKSRLFSVIYSFNLLTVKPLHVKII